MNSSYNQQLYDSPQQTCEGDSHSQKTCECLKCSESPEKLKIEHPYRDVTQKHL